MSGAIPEHLWLQVGSLAQNFGVELRLEHDCDAPMPWAVWCWSPDVACKYDAEIIGAGAYAADAVNEAHRQLVAWEHAGWEGAR